MGYPPHFSVVSEMAVSEMDDVYIILYRGLYWDIRPTLPCLLGGAPLFIWEMGVGLWTSMPPYSICM